jgi:uncharacterized membrane protein
MFWKIYLIALSIFLAIDALWLGVVAKKLYQKELGFLMSSNINWISASVFYLLFVLGLVVFVINPALKEEQWMTALLLGILFGVITYATYDLTNLATIEGWPINVTIIDIFWGAFIASSVSLLTYFITTKLIL